jgi:hypothetical protein
MLGYTKFSQPCPILNTLPAYVNTKITKELAILRRIAYVVALFIPTLAACQADETSRSWNQPVEPFRIAGNLYYVGASDITSYLIITPEGHILLDGGFVETVPLIRDSVKKLGFKMEDVKLLLSNHAHYDHVGGLAAIKEQTGAKLVAAKGTHRSSPAAARAIRCWATSSPSRRCKPTAS